MKGALLFDLDGTLVDSDPLHAEVFVRMYAERGRSIDRDHYMAVIHGRLSRDSFAEVFPDEDPDALADEKEEIFRRDYAPRVPPVPGIAATMDRARVAGLKIALVSNAPRGNAQAMLAASGVADRIDAVVLAEDVARGKPHPDPYLAALTRLNVPAARAIAFEDSPTGIASSRAAGIFTVALRTSLSAARLTEAGADATILDFTDPALPGLIARLTGA
ncbi:MAG: HAD family hydrolase [Paracoccaceae bacterium]